MSTFAKIRTHSDKIEIYDNIVALNAEQKAKITVLIQKINRNLSIDFDGFKVLLNIIKPIIKNRKLEFFINRESVVSRGANAGSRYPILTYMLSAYLDSGFLGSVQYNLTRKDNNGESFTTDRAIRESSDFVFSTLKYQLVKYLGIFNLMYRYEQSEHLGVPIDEVIGIDRLLLKLEYNAVSNKGRLASDYGVPSKIVDYYENEESDSIRSTFDSYENKKFEQLQNILNS